MNQIAVIGAGISGTIAAHILKSQGYQVTLFEKNRKVGGRSSTQRFTWAHIDMGTQYITVQDPDFAKQIEIWMRRNKLDQWNFTPYIFENNNLQSSPDDVSRFVGIPRMNTICEDLAEDLKILLETTITDLEWEQDHWTLVGNDDMKYGHFDTIISTLPAPLATQLCPADMALKEELAKVKIHPMWTLALQFENPIAPSFDPPLAGIFFNDGPLKWAACNTDKPGRPGFDEGNTWVLHFTPQWTIQHNNETNEAIIEHGVQMLADMLQQELPAPRRSVARFWPNAILPDDAPEPGIFTDPDKRLIFAGDWCKGGRFEGAYISGMEAAAAVKELNY